MSRIGLVLVALATCLAVGVHFGSPAEATILIKKNLEQLAAESELVVVGTITAKSSNWAHGFILSHHTIEVERTLKGKAPEQLVITEVGGTVGDMTMRIESAPTYEPGQRVLVTLKKGPMGYWRTLGWTQGRYAVSYNRVSEQDVIRFTRGLEYVTKPWFGKDRVVELEDFCDTFSELVEKAAREAAKKAAEQKEEGR